MHSNNKCIHRAFLETRTYGACMSLIHRRLPYGKAVPDVVTYSKAYTLTKESYHDVENPDQLRVLAFSTLH